MKVFGPLGLVLALCLPIRGGTQLRKISEPPGNTLQKAFEASALGQPGAKPFHIRVAIAQSKGPNGDYTAVVEETWVSETQWVRTISGPDLLQKTVVDDSGPHIMTQGNYYPTWLRAFVMAIFKPVAYPPQWNLAGAPIEHVELPNGRRSSPCQHAEFKLGVPPAEQVNFANYCFQAAGGLLESAQSPDYAMEFKDYASFGKLKVARTLISHPSPGIEVIGKVTVLEAAADIFKNAIGSPSDFTSTDPLETITLSAATMMKVANGIPALRWPSPLSGRGMFTAWISLDRTGRVREARPLNSDESALAAAMTSQLIGMQWKPVIRSGSSVQAQGPIVFEYPAPSQAIDQR